MSQESLPTPREVPSWTRYSLARITVGRKVARKIKVTTEGFDEIPRSGPASAVSNHRNNVWDIPIIGEALAGIRSPFYPAKSELNHGLQGWVLSGSGAIFFDRNGDIEEMKRVESLMIQHLLDGHVLMTMVEGTSKNRGQELGEVKRGALNVALAANLDELLLVGLAGTETEKVRPVEEGEDPADVDDSMPTRVHIQIGTVSLLELTERYRQEENEAPKVPSRAQREYLSDYIIPAHQAVIDSAYKEIAA